MHFVKLSGYEPFELIGKSYDVIKHPDYVKKKVFMKVYGNYKIRKYGKVKLKNSKRNGDVYWLKTTIHP